MLLNILEIVLEALKPRKTKLQNITSTMKKITG
jgi:hypothetical protein